MKTITLRAATGADLEDLKSIYIDSVRSLGPRAYSAAAVAAWQRWPRENPEDFEARVMAGHPWVAEVDGTTAAFAAFTAPDHLDFLYTRGEFARMGLASRLHEQLEGIARSGGASLLRTEASYLSRPVFGKFGYEVFKTETVERYGQSFRRFNMRKFLRPESPAVGPLAPCRSDYTAAFATAPKVEVDTRVRFEKHDPNHPGWFTGSTTGGTVGYFPVVWFEVNEAGGEATALRDYDARELTVRSHTQVGIIEVVSSWARCMTENGEIGWLPVSVAPAQG